MNEGDRIDLGDRAFSVLSLPGHTPGSIGLWDEADGTLFCGDAVYAEDPLIDQAPTSDVEAYLRHDAPPHRPAGRASSMPGTTAAWTCSTMVRALHQVHRTPRSGILSG